jgi:hypothetical protein
MAASSSMDILSGVSPRGRSNKSSAAGIDDEENVVMRTKQSMAISSPLLPRRKGSHDDNNNVVETTTTSNSSSSSGSYLIDCIHSIQRSIERACPALQRAKLKMQRIPPRYKFLCIVVWIGWKFVAAYLFIAILRAVRGGSGGGDGSPAGGQDYATGGTVFNINHNSNNNNPLKVLYIVTTLAEYNTGKRETVAGQDRLADVVLPVLVDSVESMVYFSKANYQVDVVLILAYPLRPDRYEMIRRKLPSSVGLEIWDDACPLGYDVKHSTQTILDNTRALSRQHRYVMKDRIPYYDLFLAFEDDMRITGHHVHQFVALSQQLERLQQATPAVLDEMLPAEVVADPYNSTFFGPMPRQRLLERLIPGFIRVEVLLNATDRGAQLPRERDPIPISHEFYVHDPKQQQPHELHFDPSYCCHVQMSINVPDDADTARIQAAKDALPPALPSKDDIVIWETSVKALSARKLPPLVPLPNNNNTHNNNKALDWIILLPGPGKRLPPTELMGGYWSGRNGAYGKNAAKPSPGEPDLIAQQGGWMALTKQQILRVNHDEQRCMGTILPPFDGPIYHSDGQESMNVEFWSGGYQLFTGVRGGCNLQRFIPFSSTTSTNSGDNEDGDDDIATAFSKHFIYHVANNKQKQLARRRMVRADDLFGQLNTVVQMAKEEEQRQLLLLASNNAATAIVATKT